MEIIGWLVLLTVFAIIGYLLGASKGTGSLGFLLGLLLGPFGWLIVVLVNLNKRGVDDQGMAAYLLAKQQAEMAALKRAQMVRSPLPVPELKKVRVQREGRVIGNWPVDEVREKLETGELAWEDLYFDASKGNWVQLAGHPEV